ncbi:unnamed protein product [Caenorhabditis bovis]|uniref:Uncharacterized protein n=1 Tax=Caenorhabditis bovis TaxID=2654633 RepID=A0A8S1EXK8_9PELO|nr:unnamed protein product [Caenorhabditis bovis]
MSTSSEEQDTTLGRGSSHLYSQPRAGPSQQSKEGSDDDDPYVRFREEDIVDVDDAITVMLSSLRFEHNRKIVPTERDDDALRRLHEKIFAIITRETDDHRRRRLKRALPASNCIREQVFYLRRSPTSPSPSYFHRLSAALDTIVKDSFEEEYRKVATILGLVEALAEVLILEIHTFGVSNSHHNEHRSIRKLIANALTNLTYGQIHSKRRLCAYDGFIRCVVRIIIESPNVTQVYAGLVRNLSWMADAEMSESLRPTVHALAIAAVHANKNRDEGCVKATLSALWNLASHSVENKRTICDTPNFLALLASLLSTDVRHTGIGESATGILKYVSQYLANTSSHLELRNILLTGLISLLGSPTFTILTNTLGAIANLISKDPHLQNVLRHDMNAIQQLNLLRNSNREDVRAAVKNVLNAVNQPTGHTRFGEMSCSMGAATGMTMMDPMMHSHHTYHSASTASPRLLPLRATRASPGRFMQQLHPPQSSIDQRSCSLPRHFAGGFAQPPQGMMAQSYTRTVETQEMFMNQPEAIQEQNDDPIVETQSETAMGTRSNSARSLGSADPGSVMNTGGWNSTIDTAANSSRALSPVSFSEIPASPTMCTQVFNLPTNSETASEQQTPVYNQMPPPSAMISFAPAPTTSTGSSTLTTVTATTARHNATQFSTGSSNTMTRSGNTTKPAEELESPDDVLPGPNFDEGDYAVIPNDEELLSRSIQAEMPSRQQAKVSPRLNGFFSPPLSSQSGQQSTNSAWYSTANRNNSDSDRLLMECILSEMPQSTSPSQQHRRHSKNEQADRRDATIASHEPSDHGVQIIENLNVTGSNCHRSTLGRMESLESQASSDDSFGVMRSESSHHTMMREDVDTSIPADCYDDDDDYDDYDEETDLDATHFEDGTHPNMTIDCSIISSGSAASLKGERTSSRENRALATSTPKGSSSGIPTIKAAHRVPTRVATARKTRLPVPKTNGSLADKITKPPPMSRPRLPPKPMTLNRAVSPEEPNDDQKDETIYVNAPAVQEKEQIYVNTAHKEPEAETTSIGSGASSTKSILVPPYNYQKPFVTRSSGEMSEKSVQPNPKQMLVTTV